MSGNLLNRLVRTYDVNGRVADVRYTIENFLFSLPVETQQQFLAEPDAVERITQGLTELLGEQRNFIKITYGYDADGRLIEKHQYIGHSLESTTTISYNDHSDKLEEREFTTGDPNPPRSPQAGEASSDAPLPQRESETHYSYKYDTFGNWTEQTSSSVNPTYVSVTRRTIVYY
jgi:YD repeat-containing protein